MPRFVCSVCGREFDKGAYIIENIVLCPSCAAKLRNILDDCESRIYKAAIENNISSTIVDKCVEEYGSAIESLKLRKAWFIRRLYSTMLAVTRK